MSYKRTAADEASSNLADMDVAGNSLAIEGALISVDEEGFSEISLDTVESNVNKIDPLALPKVEFLPNTGAKPKILPSSAECTVLKTDELPQLSKWDVIKSKIYLGSAYGGTRMEAHVDPKNDPGEGSSAINYPKPMTIEGLGELPSHKSSKPTVWTKLREAFGKKAEKGFKDVEEQGVQEEMPQKVTNVTQDFFYETEGKEKNKLDQDDRKAPPFNASNALGDPEC